MPFHLGVKLLAERLSVSAISRFECAFERVDVLLRHRLLRQPGGFEGLVLAGVGVAGEHQSVSDGDDRARLPSDVDVRAPWAAVAYLLNEHSLIPKIHKLNRVDSEPLDVVLDVEDELDNRLRSMERPHSQ